MEELIKKAAKSLDDRFDFNKIFGGIGGFIAERLDGVLFNGILTKAEEKIPEDYKDEYEILLKALSGDFTNFSEDVSKRLNEAVDIPGLNEEEEGIWLRKNIEAVEEIARLRQRDGQNSEDDDGNGEIPPGEDPGEDPPG